MQFLLISFFLIIVTASPEYDRGMLNLTAKNFNQTLAERDGIIVLYYGNNCELW